MENGEWKTENIEIDFARFPSVVIHLLFSVFRFPFSIIFGLILIFSANFHAQKIAVLAPEKNQPTRSFIEKLEAAFPASVKILDGDLSDAAYRSQNFDKPFNLTLSEAKNVGAAIGSDYFLLVKADNLRRSSAESGEIYESYGLIFVVSARTGRLVFWRAESRSSKTLNDAQTNLFAAVNFLTAEISERLKKITTEELNEKPSADFRQPPEENSPDAKDFKPPLPYKRLSPVYTRLANSYAVEATVDAEVDVDETGKIAGVAIVRWAGFGLDESVAENVRRMNWRAASKNGKAMATRVLLRYNFKKAKPADDFVGANFEIRQSNQSKNKNQTTGNRRLRKTDAK